MKTLYAKMTQRGDRGFTLIELLVVIAIIAVLAALVLAALSSAQKGSRDSKRQSDLNQYKTALAQYSGDNNGTYPTQATAAPISATSLPCSQTGWSTYMSSCIVPASGQNAYNYVTSAAPSSNFGVCAQLERNTAEMFAVGPTQSGKKANATCTPQG